ncbi:L,D-transpeptidase family protein [Nitratireductor basaltis]|uniref:L,D-TPase catalytic domain-containing protein n=1 Tax=Nitratireductor basaltis TaxID=472175 RepID=A0A084UAX1_9HYPH|nr:L,D-transpeptidase family protein [Nitratireductor basaltis]KFB10107.1 hypothetical protein EL18_01137 [Nitratireductor basaltis]
MRAKLIKSTAMMAVALAVGTAAMPTPVQAEQKYLFDYLFGGNQKRQQVQKPANQVRRAAPQARQQKRVVKRAAPKPLPKITGPQYYDYKVGSYARIDLASIAQSAEAADGQASFAAAIASLSGDELRAEKEIAAAISQYYSQNPEFIWIEQGELNERARLVQEVLAQAGEHGLDETHYAVSLAANGAGAEGSDTSSQEKALARFEIQMSAKALRYVLDAKLSRIDPNKISGYHDFDLPDVDLVKSLDILAHTFDARRYLESQHPQNELYTYLRKELAALRESAEREIVVEPDTFIRPGKSSSEFPKLMTLIERDQEIILDEEQRAVLAGYDGSETYAPEFVPLVKAAQKAKGLTTDGIIGKRTVAAIAGESKAERVEKVKLSMERLRWHPSRLGDTRVMINAASYKAQFQEDGEEKLSMRVVVGKKANQTSFFYDEIEYVEFNPYWGVPRSIIINEMLPRLRRDPGYLDRAGYEVTDSSGRRIASSSINWGRYGANIPYNVRQTPSERNALGELKIMFPNKHAIYMHDTPAKNLFSRDMRAYSHGCVRLEDPRAMAAAVLQSTREDVGAAIARGKNARRNLPRKIPVYVGYFTAFPDAQGKVGYHEDIYDRDEALLKALAKVQEQRSAGS